MEKAEVVRRIEEFVKQRLKDSEPGHDWWHIYRVLNLSKRIYYEEKKTNKRLNNEDSFLIVQLGALLHDIADYKFTDDESLGEKTARKLLKSLGVKQEIRDKVVLIINNISFKGESHKQKVKFDELDIVQDADRLDAIGALGIARAFSYGGYKKRKMFDPSIKPKKNMDKQEYMKNKGTTINHFYEKLLLLKGLMNTKAGRRIAEHRDKYMRDFLEEFYAEWNGRR